MTDGVRAVIFDWAGTMVDFGSTAPVRALAAAFKAAGVTVEDAEIRAHMGRAKRDHVAQVLAQPRVHAAWTAVHGAAPTSADADRLYGALEPLMIEAAGECAVLTPGAAKAAAMLRDRGIRIASSTGYTRAMMEAILPRAAAQGYAPEVVVCAGETLEGRPSPLMAWKALVELGVWPARACVKVDDAPVGIAEGREAGCWSIGVAASGNEVGLDLATFSALESDAREALVEAARRTLRAAGAHLVIDTVADLPEALADIERRIAAGRSPHEGSLWA